MVAQGVGPGVRREIFRLARRATEVSSFLSPSGLSMQFNVGPRACVEIDDLARRDFANQLLLQCSDGFSSQCNGRRESPTSWRRIGRRETEREWGAS